MLEVLSYIIFGGLCFMAGKQYGYWNIKRLLDKDLVKREIQNEIKRGLDKDRISRYKKENEEDDLYE